MNLDATLAWSGNTTVRARGGRILGVATQVPEAGASTAIVVTRASGVASPIVPAVNTRYPTCVSTVTGDRCRDRWPKPLQSPNSNRTVWRPEILLVRLAHFQIWASHREFFFSFQWYIKSNFLRFFWLSMYSKALQTKKIWISWRASPIQMFFYLRSKIMKMLLTSENFEDSLRPLV